MELEKIFGTPIQRTDASVRRTVTAKEDTSDTFARVLQNFKEMKAAEARDWAEKVGDTVITRILADGTVITQIYEGTKLISQIVTRGAELRGDCRSRICDAVKDSSQEKPSEVGRNAVLGGFLCTMQWIRLCDQDEIQNVASLISAYSDCPCCTGACAPRRRRAR